MYIPGVAFTLDMIIVFNKIIAARMVFFSD